MAMLDYGAQVEKTTTKNSNTVCAKEVRPSNVVYSFLSICWKTLARVYRGVFCFLCWLSTRNTIPIVHIKSSEDKISFRIYMDDYYRLNIIIYLPYSIQQESLMTNDGYRFELQGYVNRNNHNVNGIPTASVNCNNNQNPSSGLEYLQANANAIASYHHFVYKKDISSRIDFTSYINTNEINGMQMSSSTNTKNVNQEGTTLEHHTGRNQTGTKKVISKKVDDVPDKIAKTAQCAKGDDLNRKPLFDLNTSDFFWNNGTQEEENKCDFEIPHDNSVSNASSSKSSQTDGYTNTDNTRLPTVTYSDIQNGTYNIVISDRKKMKTNKIRRDKKSDNWKRRVKGQSTETLIRQYTEDFFSSKQSPDRPHVLWPSMHPLLPHKERILEDDDEEKEQ